MVEIAKVEYEGYDHTMRFSAPILDRLSSERIFCIIEDDGSAQFMEMCDEYFHENLTIVDLRQLAAELLAVADALDVAKPAA